MDALRQTFEQYRKLLGAMSPSQRGTLIAVPAMIAGAFLLLMWNGTYSSYVALSFGKRFTSEELHLAEQSLKDAGLTEFRTEGQQIMVPAKEADRYNAAVIISDSSLSGWAEQLAAQIESEGSFANLAASDTTRQLKKDIALGKHLRSMIRTIPAIDDGFVQWARPDPRSRRFGHRAPVTATVWVKPHSGREISSSLVGSLRAAVANSVADLSAGNVTVMDLSTGRAYTPDADGEPFDSKLIAYIDEHRQRYKRKIDEALQYIPGVLVAVEVELDKLQSSVEQETRYDPKLTAPRLTIENSRTENSRQQPGRAEPGVQSNRGREVAVSGGLEKSHSAEDKQTTTLNNSSVSTSRRELIGALPKAVTVSVSIPRNHYRKIAQNRGLAPADQELDAWLQGASDADKKKFEDAVETIRQEEEAKAKASVQKLIPPGSPEDAVSVISFEAVEPDVPKLEVSAIDTLSGVLSRWGGAIGLALLAFWVVRMLRKSMPQTSGEEPIQEAAATPRPPDVSEPVIQEEPEPLTTERDELQAIVRDDPDTAAAVLSKWLQAVK